MSDIPPIPKEPAGSETVLSGDEFDSAGEVEMRSQSRVNTQADYYEPLREHRSMRSDVWRQFRRHKGAMVGSVILLVIVLATVFGPMVSPHDAYEINLTEKNQGASLTYPLGTDNLGRDLLTRVLIGGRISLSVGLSAMLGGLIIGVLVGVVAGFFRRWDGPLMRITDLFISLPQLPLLLVILMLFKQPVTDRFGEEAGVFILVVGIISLTASWMNIARLLRGDVLAIKEEEFVLASRSIGTGSFNLIKRHILPNVLSPVIVSASLGVATAIITESALSFLGLGFPSTFPTWGRLLSDGTKYLEINAWWAIAPGALITITVLCINFIGDGLRDALDPKLRSKG